MVLQRTCHDFRGRRRTAIHENNDAGTVENIAAPRRAREPGINRSTVCRHDDTGVEKQVSDVDRGLKDTARVVTQIQDQALDHATGSLLKFVNGPTQISRRIFAELADPYVAVGRREKLAVHTRHADNTPAHRVIDHVTVSEHAYGDA